MKISKALIVLIATFAMVCVIAGCAQTPNQRLTTALGAYTTAAETTTALIRSGAIKDPATLRAIAAASEEARAAIGVARNKVALNEPIDADFWIDVIDNAQRRILAYLARTRSSVGAKTD